jgi:hypothetical protein
MTWTLLRKELREHWPALLLVAGAAVAADAFIIAARAAKGGVETPFEGLRLFIASMGVLGALVLNHRLVVVEYQSRTQLFLEGLPVARWWMVLVKYWLGLGVLLLVASAAIAVACLMAGRHEIVSGRQVLILAARALSVVWLAHSLCFLMGLLGRYRLALYIGLGVCCAIIQEHKVVDLAHFGPVALLDGRFAYEAESFPWDALRMTWALSLAFMVLAFGLSLTWEGSVAALLAQKMSHREKVFIAALLAGLLFTGSVLSDKAKKAPFDLLNVAVASRPGVVVKVASGAGESDPRARRLADYVAAELAAAREYLGAESLPAVFITARRDLDANRYERGELARSEGVHARANFFSRDWRDEDFLAWLMREVLAARTNERATLESRRWVLEAFGLFWTGRDHQTDSLARDRALALRALYGVAPGFTPRDLRAWLRYSERVGGDIAAGVAWSGLKTLAKRQGPEGCQRFLRAVLGTREPKDVRASLRPIPWEQILREQSAVSAAIFFEQWQQELAVARHGLAGELARLPRLRGEVNFIPLSSESRKVRFRLTIAPPPAPEARYSFLYSPLEAFDEEVGPHSIRREQNNYGQHPAGELPETYSRGGRLYWTLALPVPALGCQVVSGWNRQEIR